MNQASSELPIAETPFAETEALLAVLRGDEDAAVEILAGLTRIERRRLAGHLSRLASLAFMWCAECSLPIRPGQGHGQRGLIGYLYHTNCPTEADADTEGDRA